VSALRTRVKASPLARSALFLGQNAWYGVRSLGEPRAAGGGSSEVRYRLAAMIRVKDEARFLPEWLAHHLELGVEHVVVYDNNSSDGTAEAIAPFVAEGSVTVVPWPTVPASPASHLDFLARFGPGCAWVAFLDADEFLVEPEPGALAATLAAAGPRVPAIGVNWRYFGSAGHERIPAGLVTERFDRADAAPCYHVKAIARPAAVYRYRNSHNFYYRGGRLARTPQGRRVYGSFVSPPDRPRLVINHYVYRSREDYERKAARGFVDASGAREQARTAGRADAEFGRHNDVRVTLPEATLDATAGRLRRLGLPPELYRRSGVSPR
jgi:Glycosyl transferase family 2